MNRWRRLTRAYEQRIDVADAMIHVARGVSSSDASAIQTIFKRTSIKKIGFGFFRFHLHRRRRMSIQATTVTRSNAKVEGRYVGKLG